MRVYLWITSKIFPVAALNDFFGRKFLLNWKINHLIAENCMKVVDRHYPVPGRTEGGWFDVCLDEGMLKIILLAFEQ